MWFRDVRLGFAVNVAVTEASLVSVTLHVPVPVQAPDQPANVEVVFGAAVRVTMVPLVKVALQVAPQLIPAGLLVIVPPPVPALLAVNWKEVAGGGLELLLEPQPQSTNEMIARQKKLKTAFNVYIVCTALRPARQGEVASPDA
jgi:hypothetical protein